MLLTFHMVMELHWCAAYLAIAVRTLWVQHMALLRLRSLCWVGGCSSGRRVLQEP